VRRQPRREVRDLIEEEVQVSDAQEGRSDAVQIVDTAGSCRVWYRRYVISIIIRSNSEQECAKLYLGLPHFR
jgi:hypothetical protein